MGCASITITRAPSSRKRAMSVVFSSRPSIFVANLQNGCTTIEGTDLSFPDPGPDVTDVSTHPGGVTGACKAVAGVGAFGSSAGSSAQATPATLGASVTSGGSTTQVTSEHTTIARTHAPSDSTAVLTVSSVLTSLATSLQSEQLPESCSWQTGTPLIPSSPNLSASPDPLWAVPSGEKGCYDHPVVKQ